MAKRTRENVAILLFFLPLAYVVFKGWDNFYAAGYTGVRGYLNVLVPAVLMTVGIVLWPARSRDDA